MRLPPDAREAPVQVQLAQVTLRPPQCRAKQKLASVAVSVVRVHEVTAPTEGDPVEWILVTTRRLQTPEEALECVEWYCVRWQIEVWHKVLKSGCRIEARQLGQAVRLEKCLCLYSIVAWRVLMAVMLSRAAPTLSCEVLLEPAEWQALVCHVTKRAQPPAEAPNLQEAVGWLARLGGHLGRKGDGPPGVTVLWRGFQRLSDLMEMYRIMRRGLPPPFVGKC